jgi:hypothetical protein
MSHHETAIPGWVRLNVEGLNIIIEVVGSGKDARLDCFERLRGFLPPSGACQHWPKAITVQCAAEGDAPGELDRIIRLIERADRLCQ